MISNLILFLYTQECFKGNWSEHKKVHKKERMKEQMNTVRYNPWPGYMFTGKLRPFPLVSIMGLTGESFFIYLFIYYGIKSTEMQSKD